MKFQISLWTFGFKNIWCDKNIFCDGWQFRFWVDHCILDSTVSGKRNSCEIPNCWPSHRRRLWPPFLGNQNVLFGGFYGIRYNSRSRGVLWSIFKTEVCSSELAMWDAGIRNYSIHNVFPLTAACTIRTFSNSVWNFLITSPSAQIWLVFVTFSSSSTSRSVLISTGGKELKTSVLTWLKFKWYFYG